VREKCFPASCGLHPVGPGAGWSDGAAALQHGGSLGPLAFDALFVTAGVDALDGGDALELHVAALEVLALDDELEAEDRGLEALAAGYYLLLGDEELGVGGLSVDHPFQIGGRFRPTRSAIHADRIADLIARTAT
jgi:hypothetical protein